MVQDNIELSDKERDAVRRLAGRFGVGEEEVINLLIAAELESRVRIGTGRGPAKVYGLPRKQK